ncbi:glucose-methanol-choline oxidoreductase [Usnea florida]
MTVVLIDAGGTNADPEHQNYGARWWTFMTAPGYNWGYKTTSQEHLNGRELEYSRGKGLGGSTCINFCVYTRGPKADYEQWAHLVGDNSWSWEHVLERFKKLERFRSPLEDHIGYADISSSAHGFDGPLAVGLPHVWDPKFGEYFDIVTAKYTKNLDLNSGNPIGMSVGQICALDGRRITASNAFLSAAPANLTIITNAAVEKILFEGRKAVGVRIPEKTIYVRQEVIISAGALDSPKLLLLSGIGSKDELAKYDIAVVQNLPGVGQNLRDHLWLELVTTQKSSSPHRTSYIRSPDDLHIARAQWMENKTGPLSDNNLPQMIGYLKCDRILDSKEFQELDSGTREYFEAETTPIYELISHNVSFNMKAPEEYLATAVAFMGGQAAGEVKLRSGNPKDPPLVDPKFLNHPFDRRVAIESVREAFELLDLPALAKDQIRLARGPIGRSDEDILEYIRSSGMSMWHMCGTVKMGKPAEPDTCVDKDFRVLGVQGLRVVDMSVAPLMSNAHTQAVAYVIGETAAEKMIAEHNRY